MVGYSESEVKKRLLFWLQATSASIAIPFGLYRYHENDSITAALIFFTAIPLVIGAWANHVNHRNYLLRNGAIVYAGFFVLILVYRIGILGFAWSFPLVLAYIFVFSSRAALFWNMLFVSAVIIIGTYSIDNEVLVRQAVALIITMIFGMVFSKVIQDQRNLLERAAYVDVLTGALNRRGMSHSLGIHINQFQRHPNIKASIILLDIDHFKEINDKHGHTVGDEILAKISEKMMNHIRKEDLFFRYGGEEFLILAPLTELKDASQMAEGLRVLIEQCALGINQKVTISCGVAELNHSDTEVSWIERADKALYEAKRLGRNKVVTA